VPVVGQRVQDQVGQPQARQMDGLWAGLCENEALGSDAARPYLR
jgi:hypothetical protein